MGTLKTVSNGGGLCVWSSGCCSESYAINYDRVRRRHFHKESNKGREEARIEKISFVLTFHSHRGDWQKTWDSCTLRCLRLEGYGVWTSSIRVQARKQAAPT